MLCTPVPLRVLPPCCPPPPLLRPDKAGFGNNFTTGDNKSVAQNMEAVVVGCMFKSLITRCASTTHELHSPENLVSDPCSLAPQHTCCHSACWIHRPTHQLPPERKNMSHTWEFTTVLSLDSSHSSIPILIPPLSHHFFSTCLLSCSSSSFSSLTGSILRHPPAGAVYQGGARQCVPPGGAECTSGQCRKSHRHQETRGEG